MKLLWILPCLAVCACVQNGASEAQAQGAYGGYNAGYAEPQPVMTQQVANPYVMQPPAYENGNFVIAQKEQELFQKEKDLLHAQQELYEREKKLASREAEFINRSKALDYKEQNIQSGRSYAPTYQQPAYAPAYAPAPVPTPAPAPAPVAEPVPAYVPAPAYAPAAPVAPAAAATPAYTAPAPAPTCPFAKAAQAYANAQPVRGNDVMIEDTLVYSSVSQPSAFEPVQPGFIILQHPIQRDLTRCPASDDVCVQSYERLGYVRSANLSRYTTQDEVTPSGQWRENGSVPRW